MPKSKKQKLQTLEILNEKIARSKSVVFASFNGLPVKENEALRKELKQQSGEYFVAKKTLLELAFKKAKFEGLNLRKLTGQIAVIFGFGDEVAPAKLVAKYKKSS
ncbi:MAG: 50S ribosomal protein L10, partial [Candidatus Margulisiibacteriota bacterium]